MFYVGICMQNETWLHTVGRCDAPQAVMTDSDCPASPEHIRSHYGTNVAIFAPTLGCPLPLLMAQPQ